MSHISLEQRYTISKLLQQNYKISTIAEIIDKDKTVIYRELKRNRNSETLQYDPELAQKKYEKRLRTKPKFVHFTDEIKQIVINYLKMDYSPEQIVGVCKRLKIKCVSHETIYQFIWANKQDFGKYLRRKGRKYRKRGNKKDSRGIIKNRVGIEHRPPEVAEKQRFGDLEIDTVIGKNHRGALLTINDRATGLCWLHELRGKNAEELAAATIDLLMPFKPFLHTITADNGKEFAMHEMIAKALNIKFFFANPYHSWERGANENLNGLIRQYLPKGTSFENLDKNFISLIQSKLNNRPRKRLKFLTPVEYFYTNFASLN